MAYAHASDVVSTTIRAKARQRDLIDQAAEWLGRSQSKFILNAACRQEEDVLLDQAFLTVDHTTLATLQDLLDRPLPPTSCASSSRQRLHGIDDRA